MTLRIEFNGKRMGRQFRVSYQKRQYRIVADRSRRTMRVARDIILQRGAADIRQAGNFGRRWVKSLHADIEPPRGRTTNLAINVFHEIPYAGVHEFGAVIRGRPLLWIPLSWTGIKVRAKIWSARFGGLFRVDRKVGNPLLLSIRDKEPKYVGVKQVRLRQRFHLRRIVRETAGKLPSIYRSVSRGR